MNAAYQIGVQLALKTAGLTGGGRTFAAIGDLGRRALERVQRGAKRLFGRKNVSDYARGAPEREEVLQKELAELVERVGMLSTARKEVAAQMAAAQAAAAREAIESAVASEASKWRNRVWKAGLIGSGVGAGLGAGTYQMLRPKEKRLLDRLRGD